MKGPIFAHIILADEINRTPPKTQAALLEAMQEYHVTAAGRTYPLERPFFVLATQNPIELEGTYPLPEAQLDRFMFNIVMTYLTEDDEVRGRDARRPATTQPAPAAGARRRRHPRSIQQLVREVLVADEVARYAVRLVDASRPGRPGGRLDFVDKWVNWGAGLRASQALILGGKARALMHGRYHVSVDDMRALAHADPAPSHHHELLRRVGAASTSDGIVDRLIEAVPPPKSGLDVMAVSATRAGELRFLDPAVIARLGGPGAARRGRSSRASSRACTAVRSRASASSSPSTASTCQATISSTIDWKVFARTDRLLRQEVRGRDEPRATCCSTSARR